MLIDELRYDLTLDNVVGTPREYRTGRRDRGRMLVVDRKSGQLSDGTVSDLPSLLRPGDVVVLNNSKRIPGVLHGRSPRLGKIELRFVSIDDGDGTGLCRVFPMHDVAPGAVVTLAGGGSVHILEMGLTKYGLARIGSKSASIRELLKAQGTPILGFFYDGKWDVDELNPYYASEEGSVESPLAGLHFTAELVEALLERGVATSFVTLHSVGSWLPFLESEVTEHRMWEERFVVPEATADRVNEALGAGRRVVACGSTSLRALESAVAADGKVHAMSGHTDLYITPGYRFRAVNGYFTNFHQQLTSLVVLDCAFSSQSIVMNAYHEAVRRNYGFYEFGDAVVYL